MGGMTGVLVRRSHDPRSDRPRPLRVGIRRREVAVDRFVTEVVMGDGEVVAGAGRRPARLLDVVISGAPGHTNPCGPGLAEAA